tara:strand:+ start:248 stop:481 length:234 start_codon:yes stop_codon:yes gene_type:complete
MANLWFDDGELEAFNGTFQEEFHGAITKHILPHGFTIEQNKFYPASWELLCNGNFVFHGSEDECFIAFGSHLAGVGK